MTAKRNRVGFVGTSAKAGGSKEQGTVDNGSFRVRPLEARDLVDAAVAFPGAIMHLHPDPTGAVHSFPHEVASGRQNAWIAEAEYRLIGMAVLSVESQTLSRLTYLHVAGDGPAHLPAAKALAEIAIRSAWDGGCLKLAVHTRIPASHVIQYMHELGFEFARCQYSGTQRIVEFYRNLYQPPKNYSFTAGDVA